MSSLLLAKLKNKPVPKKIEQVEIIIPEPAKKENIDIKTLIVDKRKETNIDRNAILERIRMNKEFKGVTIRPEISKIIEMKTKNQQLPFIERETPQDIYEVIPIVETEAEDILKLTQPIKSRSLELQTEKQIEKEKKKKTRKLKNFKLVLEEPREIQVEELLEEKKQLTPEEEIFTIKVKKRRTKKPKELVQEGPFENVIIGSTLLQERLPPEQPKVLIRASNYYMNNRKIFVNFISSLFSPYREKFISDKKTFTCDRKSSEEFELLTHQNIVRDYLNLYSPYRGLLLYHGLGSGKTCTSIAIAEGLKSGKQIYVLTPASLRMNYIESLKKCGDPIYRKKQHWEFVRIETNQELIQPLSAALKLSPDYIRNKGGAWVTNIKLQSNYDDLTSAEKKDLNEQLDEMIRYKYKFINYNGLRIDNLQTLTNNFTINPFDNTAVIIDEAHNLISRISNKVNKPDTLSYKLYNYLMDAQNAKIVFLTGTPIINYQNEIGILYNMLRGRIKSWNFKLNISSERKISLETIKTLFESKLNTRRLVDYIEYKSSSTTLTVTRNPFGFISSVKSGVYEGINVDERGNISDEDFVKTVVSILKTEDIKVQPNSIRVESYKALPDTLEQFMNYFIDKQTNIVKNVDLLKRRILGLTSYFRSIEELMPRFNPALDLKIIRISMSDFQLGIYEEERIDERKQELKNARKKKKTQEGVYTDTKSSYRIFSRLACNFVCPRPYITCPKPRDHIHFEINEDDIDENDIDAIDVRERVLNDEGDLEADDIERVIEEHHNWKEDYSRAIKETLDRLWESRTRFLTPESLQEYSPKFLNILENITDPEHIGLHLIYSQFRQLQGIGILKLVLLANGFTEFKIRKNSLNRWIIDMPVEDLSKPAFALYTGTESAEEKEIIRNIYNSSWNDVPTSIVEQIQSKSPNNFYGEIIKVLMITASGAEGIDLKNVRYVHLTESYWHPVRLEQVIGRAKRICSHNDLPQELQTVEVFLYLMTFSQLQIDNKLSTELKLKDRSDIDRRPITTDEKLFEVATIKENINKQLLKTMKETSIDCSVNPDNTDLQCYSFGNPNVNSFSYLPEMTEEETDAAAMVNRREVTWKAIKITILGIDYAYNEITRELYDLDSYVRKNPIKIGSLEIFVNPNTGKKAFKIIRI
jgi:hypothetical protein